MPAVRNSPSQYPWSSYDAEPDILGSTVIGGMIAASGIAIFLIPVTFYVIERFAGKKIATQLEKETPIAESA